MNRPIALLVGLALGATALTGVASAQEATDPPPPSPGHTNVDGSYVVATDDGAPVVQGEGTDLIYGDVNSGGVHGEGSISDVPPPDLSSLPVHPGPGGMLAPPADDGTEAVPPADPSAAPPADAATTDAPPPAISEEDGTATTLDDTGALTPAAATCADYASWYDAQVAYEAAGGPAADPAFVAAFDPDHDWIACEERMLTA